MGGPAAARCLDSRGNDTFSDDIRAGVDADFVLLAETLPVLSEEMYGDECVLAIERTNSSRLHVSETAQEECE